MPKGVVRKLDRLGRAVPPSEYRKALGIEEGDPVDMYLDGDRICIEPLRLQCICCGDTKEDRHKVVDGVHLCPVCYMKFGRD